MALPTLTKTWEFDTNVTVFNDIARGSAQAHADKRGLLLAIKNAMIDNGSTRGFTTPWEVRGSSDSSTSSLLAVGAGGPGTDRWIDIDDLIWHTSDGGARSWVVLRQTGISATFELLIDCRQGSTNDDGGEIRGIVSQAGFTGGSTTARPTATDERSLVELVTWGAGSQASDTAPYTMHFMISSDGECTRLVTLNTNAVLIGFWLLDKPKNPKSAWTTPYVARIFGNGLSEALTYPLWFDTPNMRTLFGTLDVSFYCSGEGYASLGFGEALDEENQLDGSTWFGDIGLVSEVPSFRGRQGELFDLYWTQDYLAHGRTFPDDTSRQFVVFGDMAFPWDGSLPRTK